MYIEIMATAGGTGKPNSRELTASRLSDSFESGIRKGFRLVVLIGFSFPCIFHVYKLMSGYFLYPVMVTFKVEQQKSLEFPTVTFCNLNTVEKKYSSCLKMHPKDIKYCPIDEEVRPHTLFQPRVTNPLEAIVPVRKFLLNSKGENVTGRQEFLYDYYKTPENVRMDLSYITMPIYHVFQGKKNRKVAETFNTRYGLCFSFILPKDKNNKTIKISRAGPENGLRISLNFIPNSYQKTTHTVGGRIYISHAKESPNPEEQGFTIKPGMEISIAMMQTIVKKLPSPYQRGCRDYDTQIGAKVRSQRECEKSCIQSFNFAICGCTDPTMAMSGGRKPCNLINVKQMECLHRALKTLAQDSSTCNCPPACFSTSYKALLSYSKHPSINFLKRNYPRMDNDFLKYNRNAQAIVNVFYSSLERRTIEQVPAFQVAKLLSSLGGVFGLWLGMSLLTLFEIFQKILSLILIKVKWSKMDRKTTVFALKTFH